MIKAWLFSGGKSSAGSIMSKIIGLVSALFAPVQSLCLIALEFIVIDFVIGVWASYARAKKSGRRAEWGFESRKAWHTVWKLCFVIIGIVLCDHLDRHILSFVELKLPNIFCGFICGVEFWSFLENAACISDSPLFRWLKKFMGAKLAEYAPIPEGTEIGDPEKK